MRQMPPLPQVEYDIIAFAGGMNQVAPAYAVPPGTMRDCLNFACNPLGGYYRVPGYERYDGRPLASTATFIAMNVTYAAGVPTYTDADVTIGGTAARMIGRTAEYMVFTGYVNVSTQDVPPPGAQVRLQPSNTLIATIIDPTTGVGLRDRAIYKSKAANWLRQTIGPVPGSGKIRGVELFKDVLYAFRDNVAGTGGAIYKSTPTGWQLVTLPSVTEFSAAIGTNIAEGAAITQGAATGTITRLVTKSGAYTSGAPGAGSMIITVTSGVFAAGAATVGASTLTLAAAAAPTRLPGGRVETIIANFTANPNTIRIYGCDGVNYPFEFDGVNYLPILNASPTLKPKHLAAFKYHLFFGVGGSVIHSAPGNPFGYDVVDGAGEVGIGDNVTGMLVLPGSQSGGALAIYGRNNTGVLYGSSEADWNLTNFNQGTGGIEYTMQNSLDTYALDDRGVMSLKTSLNYGNFDMATITTSVNPFIRRQRNLATASSVNRELNQYRLFFSDGQALYTTVTGSEVLGHGFIQFPDVVECLTDSETSAGDTVSYFGTTNGYVMRMDSGTSFDGKTIASYLTTNINTSKSPRIRKRYRRLVLEVQGEDYVEFDVGYNFEWASEQISQHRFEAADVLLSGAVFWDNFDWDNAFWDGRTIDTVPVELNGTGENMQILILSESDYLSQFSINAATLHFSQRRGNR